MSKIEDSLPFFPIIALNLGKLSHRPTCLADCVEILMIDVIVCDHFQIVRVILYRRFWHGGSKIQKTQFGILFDNPHYFERVVEPFVHRCVCQEEKCKD